MAVKIRLSRRGRKKMAMYDVIVADARSPRDGRLIEKLGTYNPLTNPASIVLNEEKALDWLMKGAQPTDTARRILSHKGLLLKKHLQVGVLKGAVTQEQADKKFDEWLNSKEASITSQVDSIAKKKADAAKSRFEAEKKVNEAKAEALKKKMAALVPEEVVEETVAEEAPANETVEAPVAEEVVVEEKVEAPVAKETAPVVEEVVAETPEAPAAEEVKVEEVVETPAAKEEVKEEKVEEAAPAKDVAEAPVAKEAAAEEKPAEEKKEEDKK